MIPPFLASGHLPGGIHQATIGEFEERFVRFDRSDRRLRLYVGLKRLLDEVAKIPFIKQVILAGSFVSAKPEPNDFDCLLVLDGEHVPKELRPFEYRLLARRAASKEFGGDVVAVVDGSDLHQRYLEFFQTTRDGDEAGLVELIR